MAEKSTMSEPFVGDSGGVALEKKLNQEEELSHGAVVVGDSEGVLEEKKKQEEQEDQLSHRVVVHSPSQQKLNHRDLRLMEEILNTVGALSFAIALGIVIGAIFENKTIDGNLSLSLALFIISTTLAFLMDLKKRHTAIYISSFTITTALGWGILAFALIVNHRSSSGSAFTIGDLEMFFRSCIIAIPQWILNAAFNLAN
ncbi:uncharacterized protein LOC130731616 [Lotus japonicus]|uniref:uncharacterized protein LOC130731616 n=1 Tax=Lotus japonicus TaxID=34305 RepID=UPI002589E877|nr:uncharacterized protein LOC130731616 [Lotus japonicus]